MTDTLGKDNERELKMNKLAKDTRTEMACRNCGTEYVLEPTLYPNGLDTCGACAGRSVAEVQREQRTQQVDAVINAATEKQVAFLTKLRSERGETAPLPNPMTKKWASAEIDRLLGMPKVQTPQPAAQPRAELEAAIYRNPENGEVYKVQRAVHGSGNLYAKKLVLKPVDQFGDDSEFAVRTSDREVAGHKATFEYVSGLIRQIKPEWRMTLDQAKEFGAIYGVCCNCGATLTNEESIEAGIGPICASRF